MGDKEMTEAELEAFSKTDWGRRIDALMAGVADAVNPVLRRLEDRIAELEARPLLKYVGTWNHGAYKTGEFVTHQGSLWHCERATTASPGTGSPDWKLAVKKGRDAR